MYADYMYQFLKSEEHVLQTQPTRIKDISNIHDIPKSNVNELVLIGDH